MDAAAARYARYLGVPAERRGGEAWFTLRSGRLALVDQAALAARLPGSTAPALPFPAALAVEVDDLSRTAAVLDDNQVAYRRAGGQLTVAARDAGGAAVIFCANAEAAFAGAPEEP